MKKAIYALAFILLLWSCKKNKSNCETWEYVDKCYCLDTSRLFACGYDCNASPVYKGKFCGDDLIDIHTDSSKVLFKDSHSETVRRFIKKD